MDASFLCQQIQRWTDALRHARDGHWNSLGSEASCGSWFSCRERVAYPSPLCSAWRRISAWSGLQLLRRNLAVPYDACDAARPKAQRCAPSLPCSTHATDAAHAAHAT